MFRDAVRKVSRSSIAVLGAWTDNQEPPSLRDCKLMGTGFFLREHLAVTAKHVVDEILKQGGYHVFAGCQWFLAAVTDGIDETGCIQNPRFEWARVVACSSDHDAAILFIPNPDRPESRKDRALRAFLPSPECHQPSAISFEAVISFFQPTASRSDTSAPQFRYQTAPDG